MQASADHIASDIPPTAYTRFIVLSGPRTGSHLIAQALNSHSQIICFREAFNMRLDFVQFGVEGYDDFSSTDIASRKADPLGFLDERIFCEHPADVRAVGFKFHYSHHWDAPAVLERLTKDTALRVVHLRRRNAVRTLVSLQLAESSGVWLQEDRRPLSPTNLARAARHPVKAWSRIPRLFGRRKLNNTAASDRRVTISVDECYEHLVKTAIITKNYEERFSDHQIFDVFYEDLSTSLESALSGVQDFLGVPPEPPTITMRRQNPEPLRDLIANYDELRSAFSTSEYASFFDD